MTNDTAMNTMCSISINRDVYCYRHTHDLTGIGWSARMSMGFDKAVPLYVREEIGKLLVKVVVSACIFVF